MKNNSINLVGQLLTFKASVFGLGKAAWQGEMSEERKYKEKIHNYYVEKSNPTMYCQYVMLRLF